MTFRIHTSADKEGLTFLLSGQMDSEASTELKRLFDEHTNGHRFILDLGDVQLVDRSVVRYLAFCETNGIELRNCPDYVRDWISRESRKQKIKEGERS